MKKGYSHHNKNYFLSNTDQNKTNQIINQNEVYNQRQPFPSKTKNRANQVSYRIHI